MEDSHFLGPRLASSVSERCACAKLCSRFPQLQSSASKALTAKRESKWVDFKEKFDVNSTGEWCELLKDFMAMANSGGGTILIGVDDKGNSVKFDIDSILQFDTAKVGDKIRSYTFTNFADFICSEATRSGNRIAVLQIGPSEIPIAFTRAGTYMKTDGKPAKAFSEGTVYFRHGAKSEPGTTDDIRDAFDRQMKRRQKEWMQGLRKVVQAPAGSRVSVLPPGIVQSDGPGATPIQIVDNPAAPEYRLVNPDKTYPHRQKEIIEILKGKSPHCSRINQFDIHCIRRVHEIEKKQQFFYKSRFGSPQYSDEFISWIAEECSRDPSFLQKTREVYRKSAQ